MKYLLLTLACFPVFLLGQDRPGLFFREDFKETPAEIPIDQQHISNPDISLHLYGPGADVIKKSHHDTPADDPYYVWSGLCEGNWAVTLSHKSSNVDLSKQAKIRWRSKQSGYRSLHVILKDYNGNWLVSNPLDGKSKDWRIREINIADLTWMELDIENIIELQPVAQPDLSKIVEIGWTDLMRGGGSNACSRVDWIEVDGFPVYK
ncbi:hypothetical protein [Membranihabitans maritimus]|uniref:hypothetical protein n=1 Tax=Membranihabitans maritimus TaxID=2904244 RepID=UPI001F1B4226|nr:hypothetical protein [Membranihabitans maritimus]